MLSDKTDSISFILRKTEVSPGKKKAGNQKTLKIQSKKNRTNYSLPHAFMEDTIRHNISQMTSTSKVYIPCPLAI